MKLFLRRGECKTLENSDFLKKGKTVISVKTENFSKSRMKKIFHCWNCFAKSSYHVEFHQILRQLEFHVFRCTDVGCRKTVCERHVR